MDPNIEPPRVQSWNVTVERQLGEDWSVAAQLSRPLLRSPLGAGGPQPGRVHGAGSVCDQRRLVRGVQHQRQPEPAPRAVLENPARAGALGFIDEHNAVGCRLPGTEADRGATRRQWRQHQRELHGLGLRGHHDAGQLRRRSPAAIRTPTIPRWTRAIATRTGPTS